MELEFKRLAAVKAQPAQFYSANLPVNKFKVRKKIRYCSRNFRRLLFICLLKRFIDLGLGMGLGLLLGLGVGWVRVYL